MGLLSAIARRYGLDSKASFRNGENPEINEFDSWDGSDEKKTVEDDSEHVLLLEVILARASGLTTREWALVFLLASVDTCVSLQVTAGGEGLLASRAEV